MIDEEHTQHLGHQRQNTRDGLIPQRLIPRNANLAIDLYRVVLYCAHTRHLHARLQRARQEQPAERALVLEERPVAHGGLLALDGQGVLDLEELGADPGIVLVALGVELGEGGETFVFPAVGDEPAGGFGEEEDEEGEDATGNDLDA